MLKHVAALGNFSPVGLGTHCIVNFGSSCENPSGGARSQLVTKCRVSGDLVR